MTSSPSQPSTYRPAGNLPSAPLAAYTGPWNVRLAAHLLRRAGFGGTPEEIARATGSGMNGAVEALVHFPSTDALPPPPDFSDDAAAGFGAMRMRLRDALSPNSAGMPGAPEASAAPMMEAMAGANAMPARAETETASDPAAAALLAMRKERNKARRAEDRAMVLWWLNRMLATPAPLQEKLTFYLHGQFTSADGAKGVYGSDMVEQNALLRRYALGNWRELTHGIARDRAMLKYLDNARNVKAHPNENFARELMELFTLGIGNYTEADVRESARAFTGYTFARRTGQFYFNAAQHDDGTKTFLGKTGNFNGDDVIDIIFAQPAAPKYFARRLLEYFVYSDPEPQLVDELAAVIRKNDFNMAPVIGMVLRSNVFFSERAYRALVKSPVEFVLGSYKLYELPEIKPDVIPVLARMGQIPFHPPSVKGWDGGATWLNTQTVLARENFASGLMADVMQAKNFLVGRPPSTAGDATRLLTDTILQGDASPASLANLQAYLDGRGTSANGTLSGENYDERIRGAAYLTMAMPAYQLS